MSTETKIVGNHKYTANYEADRIMIEKRSTETTVLEGHLYADEQGISFGDKWQTRYVRLNSPFIHPQLMNGFANYGGSFGDLEVKVSDDNRVTLQGTLRGSASAGEVIAILDDRLTIPNFTTPIVVVTNGGFARVDVVPDYDIQGVKLIANDPISSYVAFANTYVNRDAN